MAKTMTASVATITDGQIENVVAKLRDSLRKHRTEFGSESAQRALGVSNLGARLLEPFRAFVEADSNMLVRHAHVNRSRAPQEMLDATGRKQYTDKDVVATIPQGEGEEADVYFFKLDRYVSVGDLAKEYELRGLKPDPYAQGAVNEADPAFANEHPNGSQWQDARGRYCYVAFFRWSDERNVDVYRFDNVWYVYWWFAGVRK